jgi:hypothetical protein
MFYTDDAERDFAMHDMEQARREARLPVCDCCKVRIYDDYFFEIDGEILCEECMFERYRKSTEDYIEI